MYINGKSYPLDSQRATALFLHASSPLDVLNGTSVPFIELTRLCENVKQSSRGCSVELTWHDELYGANQPRIGHTLEVKLEGESYWIGVVRSIDNVAIQNGKPKRMSLDASSRDQTPAWRDVKRATDVYPTATPLAYIAKQVAQAIGLTAAEIALPDTGASTVHSNVQLADLSPWAMLTTLYQPSGMEPFVDCRGRLKCVSRSIQRPSDVILSDNRRLLSVSGGKSRPALTEMSIKWLDPNLTEVAQQDRMLCQASITAGFFQLHQVRDVYFSPDQTQRARNTHLVIKQSANSGLRLFCTEQYEQDSTTSGKIKVTTSIWAPALATAAMAVKFAAHSTPDGVQTDVVTGTGVTIPRGRLLEFEADAVILLTMMSMGTGMYEVWGTPFSYVHARNTTTAYNPKANVWEIQPQEIESDFVMNEDYAQAFAARELIYSVRSASSFNINIVDDTRIEPGDIIELQDGTRVYVTEYSRDLSYGASAVLQITGFRADTSGVTTGKPVSDTSTLGTVPTNSAAPTIAGSTAHGATLTATPGVWAGSPAPTVTGQWYASGVAIAGETGLTYTSVLLDVGKSIMYVESASSTSGGPVTQPSNLIVIA